MREVTISDLITEYLTPGIPEEWEGQDFLNWELDSACGQAVENLLKAYSDLEEYLVHDSRVNGYTDSVQTELFHAVLAQVSIICVG